MSGMILKVPSLFHPLADTQLFDDGHFFHVPFDDVIVDGLDNVVVWRDTLGPVYGNRLLTIMDKISLRVDRSRKPGTKRVTY